jgi:hypothetical protein
MFRRPLSILISKAGTEMIPHCDKSFRQGPSHACIGNHIPPTLR